MKLFLGSKVTFSCEIGTTGELVSLFTTEPLSVGNSSLNKDRMPYYGFGQRKIYFPLSLELVLPVSKNNLDEHRFPVSNEALPATFRLRLSFGALGFSLLHFKETVHSLCAASFAKLCKDVGTLR